MAHTAEWTLESAVSQIEYLQESIHDMQALVAEDRGWGKIGGSDPTTFTHDDRRDATNQCRVMAVMNPLIKRGGIVRAGYVWGQGIGITAKDETLNDVVQAWIDDDENRSILTGHQAHLDLENRIYTDGNVFVSLWTDPLTGRVRPRILESTEIVDIITNPDDKTQVWYYKRSHTVNGFNPDTGDRAPREVVTYYPDLRYRPATRRRRIGQGVNAGDVRWDAPVLHVYDNSPTGSTWGVGDAYAAIPWAKGYSGFLNDWSRLTKALSKIAWSVSSPSRSKAQQARAGVAKAADPNGPAGSTVNLADMKLEAVPKSGATIDAESGRPLAAMIAAAVGVPVTTLLADPGQTGARAVAETLDTPTENDMMSRRELWTEAKRAILNYVIDQVALAPGNTALRGKPVRDGDRLTVDLGDVERTLVFDWPDLTGDDMSTTIEAAVKAMDTGKMPDAVLVEVVLRALKVRDVDEIMDKLTDDDGQLIDQTATAGQAAVDAFRRGEDPAAALR